MKRRDHHIGFVWDQAGDYHMDRAEALARALGPNGRVTVFEISTRSRTYDWPECRPSDVVERVTLFPGTVAEDAGELATAFALLRACRKAKITRLFLAGYEHPGRFLAALLLKLVGRAPIIVLDSKFDDKVRNLGLELVKRALLVPYRAGLASGARAADYLRFLGMRDRPVMIGIDTVSVDRMRELAGNVDCAWSERSFLVVARLVPKKNIAMALMAFAALGDSHRQLRICGEGPLREELEAQARDLGIADRTVMLGSVTQEIVAREMAGALCLLLPSKEEQWGLVVNEALAFGLPILASDNVGAKDLLITNFVNGFLLDADSEEAWVEALKALDKDEALWERFVKGSQARACDADVGRFTASVMSLIGD
jgi:L-malate glycosyltransferase